MVDTNEAIHAALNHPCWFHSIELSPGIVTPGRKTAQNLEEEWRALRLPDLRGKAVLDIGAYDGYFSFAAERAGAARVTALDHYVWSVDMAEYMKEWNATHLSGRFLPAPHKSRHWKPEELPGRGPFDSARLALGSHVTPIVGDFMTMDLVPLGQFDVVLFLGVLYHMENPLEAMRRLAAVTAPHGLAVIETLAVDIPGLENRACCEFFPGSELNNDESNWWAPNAKAIEGLCMASGFKTVTILRDKPKRTLKSRAVGAIKHLLHETPLMRALGLEGRGYLPVTRYRAFAHARAGEKSEG